MKAWTNVDSLWKHCDSLPLSNRAFRYGMGVFETVAVRDGRALLLDAHIERLARAASDC